MKRCEWSSLTDAASVRRRTGGRRRYNAQRRRRADQRRAAIAEWLAEHPAAMFFHRGLPGWLAPAFAVHPSTIWRDLQLLLYPPRRYRFLRNGETLFTICRSHAGGPVVDVEDADGNGIRGAARRAILRGLPRCFHKRR